MLCKRLPRPTATAPSTLLQALLRCLEMCHDDTSFWEVRYASDSLLIGHDLDGHIVAVCCLLRFEVQYALMWCKGLIGEALRIAGRNGVHRTSFRW